MSDNMDNFIGLSAVLTGFTSDILAPGLDPVNIKAEYLPFFTQKIAEESGNSKLVDSIFAKYAELDKKGLSDLEIGLAMLDPDNGDDFVLACRKLIFMWYSGAWPTIIQASGDTPASTVSSLISVKSYTCGLAWKVMQSHPMGDSNYHYGYWSKSPPCLDDYTGQKKEQDS